MREGKDLYDDAVANAWAKVEKTLELLRDQAPGRNLQLLSVSYDALPGESVIDELPDQPKSSRPQAVAVTVELRAVYIAR